MTTAAEPEAPVMRGNRRVLCHIDEVGEAGKGFILHRIFKDKPEAVMPVFLVPDGNDIHCYMNMCPHQGITLEMKPDTFLDVERKLIRSVVGNKKIPPDVG